MLKVITLCIVLLCSNFPGVNTIIAQTYDLIPSLSTSDTIFINPIDVIVTVPANCVGMYTTNGQIPTLDDKRIHNGHSIVISDSTTTLTVKVFRFWFSTTSDSVFFEDGGMCTATYTKKMKRPLIYVVPAPDSIFVNFPEWELFRLGERIFYTFDGSVPDTFDNEFNGYFFVPGNSITIKAMQTRAGCIDSDIASFEADFGTSVTNGIEQRKLITHTGLNKTVILINGKKSTSFKGKTASNQMLFLNESILRQLRFCGDL